MFFTKTGNQLKGWKEHEAMIGSTNQFKIIIEAIRGVSYLGDIGIDDIDIKDIVCGVNGGLSGEWSSWTTCDATCGVGNQMRYRQCDKPTPVNGGADCVGVKSETQGCNMQGCPGCSVEILGQYYSEIERFRRSYLLIIENENIYAYIDGIHMYKVVITDYKACSGVWRAQYNNKEYPFTFDVSTKIMLLPTIQTTHYREIKVADDGIQ